MVSVQVNISTRAGARHSSITVLDDTYWFSNRFSSENISQFIAPGEFVLLIG